MKIFLAYNNNFCNVAEIDVSICSIFAPIIVNSFRCFFDACLRHGAIEKWTVLLERFSVWLPEEKRDWNTDIIHNTVQNEMFLEAYNFMITSKLVSIEV